MFSCQFLFIYFYHFGTSLSVGPLIVDLFYLDCDDETEEERYDRLNYDPIPDNLWRLIPPQGSYLKKIMMWCGYENRDAIVKLKDKGELNKMFKFVTDRLELIDNKTEMFGVFAKNPLMVTILPGLESNFKRFLSKVENLVPKKPPANTVEKTVSKKSLKAASGGESSSSSADKEKPTSITSATDLSKRLVSWCQKKVSEIEGFDISEDDIQKSFRLIQKGDRKYEFTCQRTKCHEIFALAYSNNSVKLSNVHRHILNCWLKKSDHKPVFGSSQPKAAPSSEIFFGQQKKRNGDSNSSSSKRSKNESITLHQDVDAYDHHMNRGPPPANAIDFDTSVKQYSSEQQVSLSITFFKARSAF
jgi:hypothetical protein